MSFDSVSNREHFVSMNSSKNLDSCYNSTKANTKEEIQARVPDMEHESPAASQCASWTEWGSSIEEGKLKGLTGPPLCGKRRRKADRMSCTLTQHRCCLHLFPNNGAAVKEHGTRSHTRVNETEEAVQRQRQRCTLSEWREERDAHSSMSVMSGSGTLSDKF